MKIKDVTAQNQNKPGSKCKKETDSESSNHQAGGSSHSLTNVPSFLLKTYDIVNDPSWDNIICWSEIGEGFVVRQPNEFAERVLPRYFKHNNFSSFVRQLNMYDFHKTRNNSNEHVFSHSLFRKNQKYLLSDIKRKNTLSQVEKLAQSNMMQTNYGNGTAANQEAGPALSATVPINKKIDEGQYLQGKGKEVMQYGALNALAENSAILEGIENFKQIILKLQQNQESMDEKLQAMDLKNKEFMQKNQLLWQEICKSRDREQSLERLLIMSFTCLAQMNGLNIFPGGRELLGQQFMGGVPSTSQNPGMRGSTRGPPTESNEQLMLRNESNQGDIQFMFKKFLNEFLNKNQSGNFLNLFQDPSHNAHQRTQNFVPNQGSADFLAQGAQPNQNVSTNMQNQLLDQLVKGFAQVANTSNNFPELKDLSQQVSNQFDNESNLNLPGGVSPLNVEEALIPGVGNNLNMGQQTQPPTLAHNQSAFNQYNPVQQRSSFNQHSPSVPQTYQSYQSYHPTYPQLTMQSGNHSGLNTPPIYSPDPYMFDSVEKVSTHRPNPYPQHPIKNIFGKSLSDFSYDMNQGINNPAGKRLSRTNSLAGSINPDDDASLFIAKDRSPSEVDSDTRRKRISSELRRTFENINDTAVNNDAAESNPNVEFETISSSSNSKNGSSILGKRLNRDKDSGKDSSYGPAFYNSRDELVPSKPSLKQ